VKLALEFTASGRPSTNEYDEASPLERAEVVVGGQVVATFVPDKLDTSIQGRSELALNTSTWLAIRVFERQSGGAMPPNIRYAHTSPWYVHIAGKPRASADAAAYFLQWIDELIEIVQAQQSSSSAPDKFDDALSLYRAAQEFYKHRAGDAPLSV